MLRRERKREEKGEQPLAGAFGTEKPKATEGNGGSREKAEKVT